MKRAYSILVLFLLLAFGASLAVPAEDVPETAYDESEALPYEGTPVFSIAAPLVAARITPAVRSFLHHKLVASSLFTPARVRDTDVNRSVDARVSLTLLCALLCWRLSLSLFPTTRSFGVAGKLSGSPFDQHAATTPLGLAA